MPNNQPPNQERDPRRAQPGRPDDRRQDDLNRPERDKEGMKPGRERGQERPQ